MASACKSLGNSPDPLDLIAKYGADGLRFGLMRIAPQGQDIRFDEKQVEEGRNFCNKLWNACRLREAQGSLDSDVDPEKHARSIFAEAVLEALGRCVADVNAALDAYEFSQAAGRLYEFIWNDFCANFLEAAKVDWSDGASPTRVGTFSTCDYVLHHALRLLHPFAPFVTEWLWNTLKLGTGSIQFAAWPKETFLKTDAAKAARARECYALINAGRQLRGQFNLPAGRKLRFLLKLNSDASLPLVEELTVAALLGAEPLEKITQAPARAPMAFTPLGELYLPLEGVVDPAAERARLEKQLAKLAQDMALNERKLSDPRMAAHAPAEKVKEWQEHAAALKEQKKQLQKQLGLYNNIA